MVLVKLVECKEFKWVAVAIELRGISNCQKGI